MRIPLLCGSIIGLVVAAYPTISTTRPIGTDRGANEKGAPSVAMRSERSRIVHGFVVDSGPPRPVDAKARYYVEFRARPLNVYGHTYVVYGRLDASGAPAEKRFVGLHPEGDAAGLAAGSLPMLVPATTLPLKEDAQLPVVAAYRVPITAAQYEQIQRFVYEKRSRPLSWNLYTQNCNNFAGELAKRIGLKVPVQSFQFTPIYIKQLEALNRN